MVAYHLKLEEGVTKTKLNYFCDGRRYFLHLPNLFHEFAQQHHTSGTQKTVDNLNLFKKTLDTFKYVYPTATFQTMMLALDTGA